MTCRERWLPNVNHKSDRPIGRLPALKGRFALWYNISRPVQVANKHVSEAVLCNTGSQGTRSTITKNQLGELSEFSFCPQIVIAPNLQGVLAISAFLSGGSFSPHSYLDFSLDSAENLIETTLRVALNVSSSGPTLSLYFKGFIGQSRFRLLAY